MPQQVIKHQHTHTLGDTHTHTGAIYGIIPPGMYIDHITCVHSKPNRVCE